MNPSVARHTTYRPIEGEPTRIRYVISQYDEMGECVGSFNASSKRTAIGYIRRSRKVK